MEEPLNVQCPICDENNVLILIDKQLVHCRNCKKDIGTVYKFVACMYAATKRRRNEANKRKKDNGAQDELLQKVRVAKKDLKKGGIRW